MPRSYYDPKVNEGTRTSAPFSALIKHLGHSSVPWGTNSRVHMRHIGWSQKQAQRFIDPDLEVEFVSSVGGTPVIVENLWGSYQIGKFYSSSELSQKDMLRMVRFCRIGNIQIDGVKSKALPKTTLSICLLQEGLIPQHFVFSEYGELTLVYS